MDWIRIIDFAGIVLGILYLWLEYRANIWLWAVGVIMPIVHGYLYYARGLYADFGMEAYYVVVAIYGYVMWRRKSSEEPVAIPRHDKPSGITHIPVKWVAPAVAAMATLWAGIWWILVTFTDSSVPVADAFTTALSMVAMWALAHKWAEQWLMWLVVDAVSTVLYVKKQIPFTASLYGFYTVAAVAGYVRWCRQARLQDAS
ncbi:MAG: nicotinamide mononucleotide transporter [Muribaculaceae bacterium]|nr:nicotinamide mononucleotide transporter [Muribaculaceae bacterium]